MIYLGDNLKVLRKKLGWTQAQLADKIGMNRSLIGAYEEGRSEPKLKTLALFSQLFKVNIDQLVYEALSPDSKLSAGAAQVRVLPVSVDLSGEELITLIPQKAAAGYTKGYADDEYIEKLQTANLPFPEIKQSGTLRIFQIEGDSMLPVQPGAYIIAEYQENWDQLKNGECYILLTLNDGIVYKRLYQEPDNPQELLLKSDNSEYQPYHLPKQEVLEIWRAKGVLSFDLPDQNALYELSNQRLMQMMDEMRAEIQALHQKVDGGK